MKEMMIKIAILTLLFFNVTQQASAETEDYLTALRSPDYKTRLDALKSLELMPTDDNEVYNLINTNLMNGYAAGEDDDQIEEMAWMCKTLAASGLDQYEPSLAKVVKVTRNRKLKRHCRGSLAVIETNKEALKQLGGEPIAGYSAEMSKYIRMIQSGKSSWMKTGVLKIEKSEERNEEVFDIVRDVLVSEVARIGGEASTLKEGFRRIREIGNLGHFCHCLGTSGIAKYKEDLQKVIDMTVHVSLKTHARKAMEALP